MKCHICNTDNNKESCNHYEKIPQFGKISENGHEAPISLKNICITQTIPNELFNKASKKYKKIGYRSMQEYINALIIKDTK
jgi:hypothetical protein